MKIGQVIIKYDDTGKATEANFYPDIKIEINLSDLKKLLPDGSDEDIIKESSDFIIGSWFSKMNEIELADRTEFKLKSEISLCEKYPSGIIKKCVIDYAFEKIM